MKRLLWIGLALIVLCIGVGITVTALTPEVKLALVDYKSPALEDAGLCPWRNPAGDMQAFFPGATSYRVEQMVLTQLNLQIRKRLGPGKHDQTNVLQIYRILQGAGNRGTVLVQRAAGQYGALEVVVGVKPDGAIAGVRVQRLREPAAVTAVITSSRWLSAFRDLTANSSFLIGRDPPRVPEVARATADNIAEAVRTVLIEFEEGEHRH